AAMEASKAGSASAPPADSDAVKSSPAHTSGSHLRCRLTAAYRRGVSPASRGRVSVAAAGYVVVVVFGATLAIVRGIAPGWSWTVDIAVASAVASPLALPSVHERLTPLKTPRCDIALP